MIFYAYFFCCLSQNNYLCTLIFSLLLNMQSHPTWVRGLKLTQRSVVQSLVKSRTLRGCVDWNTLCWMEIIISPSRTLRGCVDWNILPMAVLTIWSVAPYVGAWIETVKDDAEAVAQMSHPTWVRGLKLAMERMLHIPSRRTLRGCVDWNLADTACINWGLGRTLRGCVDWNGNNGRGGLANESRTLRGCVDWNSQFIIDGAYKTVSHPTWVRGLKLIAPFPLCQRYPVAPYVGAWIETAIMVCVANNPLSHPTWVRGLKHGWLYKSR